jgi:ankyrin repeat protein
VYEVVDDKTSHRVSPLWCAAVCGRLNIVKCLVKHGADVSERRELEMNFTI